MTDQIHTSIASRRVQPTVRRLNSRFSGRRCSMATRIFEPGHTEAKFGARHMMVSCMRGLFKHIHGRRELDTDRCLDATFHGEIDNCRALDRQGIRDEHLRSAISSMSPATRRSLSTAVSRSGPVAHGQRERATTGHRRMRAKHSHRHPRR